MYGFITVSIIIIMFIVLMREWVRAHVAFISAVIILLLIGVISPLEALSGFLNQSVITVGALFVIISAIQKTSVIPFLTSKFTKTTNNGSSNNLKLMAIVSGMSGFLNNIPLVLLFSPIIRKWAIANKFHPSKYLIPVSYAAILGGMCTLIGTSTNLLVHSMLVQNGYEGFTMFELALVGIPSTTLVILYMSLYGYKVLPEIPYEEIAYPHNPTKKLTVSKRELIIYFSFFIMLLCVSMQWVSMANGALVTCLAFLLLKVVTIKEAFRSIPWSLLAIIGSALGIAVALEKSGAAHAITNTFILPLSAFGPFPLLVAIYIVASVITEVITNNAAAALVFPIALYTTVQLGFNVEPYAVAIAIAASASFLTPFGYQTNLIVYEAGKYRFIDFVRAGLPVKIIVMCTTLYLIPIFWPLM
ncbi:SLC13 family permease [Guptibacillus algicola]|uniref:SLC13 family permease n=1 Tax=Guptibacillus algicola TaxID=225844 RepID=UPI001CD35A92|nr:SLC13 family permease [Alkalihalobacillus algicola]MCA0987862.1 anion permease [Alkalihalobacillus algicola]